MKKIIFSAVAVVILLLLAAGIYGWRHPLAIFNAMNRRTLKNAGFVREQVPSPVGTQTIWEAGSGPTIILLHGAGDQAGTWSEVAPALRGQYHVIALDMAGHGESEPRTGPISINTLLTGLEAEIAQRGGSEPVTIVGNSLGAWVAMLVARR